MSELTMRSSGEPPGVSTSPQVQAIADLPTEQFLDDELLLDRAPRDACVMIIDDEMINVDVVRAYLEEEGFCNFATTTNSVNAIEMIQFKSPDIVLLDIHMPEVNGLEILTAMRKSKKLRLTPVIILTAATDSETKLKALRLGASDFLSKPVDPSELLLRLENVLAAKSLRDHLTDYSKRLAQQVEIRTAELVRSRQEAISCLARAAEYRDDVTGQHVLRVGRYSAIVAKQLGFPEPAVQLIEQAAQLHDIGKIGIPDSILHKPGKLEIAEFQTMQEHCVIGRSIIAPLSTQEQQAVGHHASVRDQTIEGGASSPILKLAAVIAQTHHEKWDGSGYPNGIAGNSIPIEGRIVAVTDVFDAVSSARPYKKAFPLDRCFSILEEGRDKHFDPRVLDAFFARKDDVIAVYLQHSDCFDNNSMAAV